MQVCIGVNNISGVYLIQVSLLAWSAGWRIVNFTPTLEDNIQYSANHCLVQYKHQANPLLSMNNYTPLVISRNYKNKQLTLLGQRKLS
jgi:hypothetical protein